MCVYVYVVCVYILTYDGWRKGIDLDGLIGSPVAVYMLSRNGTLGFSQSSLVLQV